MIHSFEQFARYSMPRFQRTYDTMRANREWLVATNGGPLTPRQG